MRLFKSDFRFLQKFLNASDPQFFFFFWVLWGFFRVRFLMKLKNKKKKTRLVKLSPYYSSILKFFLSAFFCLKLHFFFFRFLFSNFNFFRFRLLLLVLSTPFGGFAFHAFYSGSRWRFGPTPPESSGKVKTFAGKSFFYLVYFFLI